MLLITVLGARRTPEYYLLIFGFWFLRLTIDKVCVQNRQWTVQEWKWRVADYSEYSEFVWGTSSDKNLPWSTRVYVFTLE